MGIGGLAERTFFLCGNNAAPLHSIMPPHALQATVEIARFDLLLNLITNHSHPHSVQVDLAMGFSQIGEWKAVEHCADYIPLPFMRRILRADSHQPKMGRIRREALPDYQAKNGLSVEVMIQTEAA